jgi:hypothetical protein
MTTHILDFELQLLLCSVAGTLNRLSISSPSSYQSIELYLEGKMFQEVSCAVGLVGFGSRSSVNPHSNSRRLRPWRVLRGNLKNVRSFQSVGNPILTVSPLDSVVDSVFTPFFTTGVANPLFNGATALRAARLRSPWVRLRANRRDAMKDVSEGD